jgi:hypothetical protein
MLTVVAEDDLAFVQHGSGRKKHPEHHDLSAANHRRQDDGSLITPYIREVGERANPSGGAEGKGNEWVSMIGPRMSPVCLPAASFIPKKLAGNCTLHGTCVSFPLGKRRYQRLKTTSHTPRAFNLRAAHVGNDCFSYRLSSPAEPLPPQLIDCPQTIIQQAHTVSIGSCPLV